MDEKFLEPSGYKLPIDKIRRDLKAKIDFHQKLMEQTPAFGNSLHSPHFELRNLFMEALDFFEEAVSLSGGNREKLEEIINKKIEGLVKALANINTAEERIKLHGIAKEKDKFLYERNKMIIEHKLKILEAIREELIG